MYRVPCIASTLSPSLATAITLSRAPAGEKKLLEKNLETWRTSRTFTQCLPGGKLN